MRRTARSMQRGWAASGLAPQVRVCVATCGAVGCSVMQGGALRSVVQCGAVWCSVCCSVLQCVAVCVAVCCALSFMRLDSTGSRHREESVLQRVLQCDAVGCSVMQCGAVW